MFLIFAFFVGFLLLTALISNLTGVSYHQVFSLGMLFTMVIAAALALPRLSRGRLRWRTPLVRALPVRAPVARFPRTDDTAARARQVMDWVQELSVHQQQVFHATLDKIGADLDEARSRHGNPTAGRSSGHFTGSHDIPDLLAEFAKEDIKNFASALLAIQQLAARRLAEIIARGSLPPADGGYPGLPEVE